MSDKQELAALKAIGQPPEGHKYMVIGRNHWIMGKDATKLCKDMRTKVRGSWHYDFRDRIVIQSIPDVPSLRVSSMDASWSALATELEEVPGHDGDNCENCKVVYRTNK